MVKLMQRGDPRVAASGLTGVGLVWPPDGVQTELDGNCDECGSTYRLASSSMAALCPECAHHLYGYPACCHRMVAGRCASCGWDGSVSPYVASLRNPEPPGT